MCLLMTAGVVSTNMALTRSSRWLMLCLAIALGRRGRSAPLTNIGDVVPQLSTSIEQFLLAVTSNLPELHVMLRATQLHNDSENVYIRWFLRQRHCPVEVGSYVLDDMETEPLLDDNRDSYVIITSSKHLRASAKRFVQRAGVFFFVLLPDDVAQAEADQENASDGEMAQIRDVMHLLWTDYSLFKNYLLTVDQRVLIYDPFDNDGHSDKWGDMRQAPRGGEQLELALFRNMRGYPLRVQIFRSVYARPIYKMVAKNGNATRQLHIQGADGKVADLLCDQLNFTMKLLDPDPNYFGERSANGTYNGAIGGIIDKRIDLCLTGFFVKDYMVPEMEFSVAVYDDQLCIYVHKANRVPQSILPVFSVRSDLWLGFILTACVCAGIWCLMRLLNLHLLTNQRSEPEQALASSRNWQMVHILIDTWVVWVRVNVLRFPPFSSERIFVASLCLVSVIFGAIFESSLATVYIHPMYYKDINTMRELDDSGLKVIYKYSSMADDLFFSETSPLFASLNKKLTHLSNLNADVMADVAAHGGKAGVTRYSSLMLESFEYIISKRVWIIPECPKYYTIAYVLPKDSPWQEAVNDLLLRFLNAGLINKWVSEMQTDVDIAIMREHRFQTDDTIKVLTVGDLQLAFYVIFAGSALAFASFILERHLKGQQRCCRWRRHNVNANEHSNTNNVFE